MSTVDYHAGRRPASVPAREAGRCPRRRPRRPHGWVPPRQRGASRHRVRGGGPGRGHREDRGSRRLPIRPGRPPLLHQVQRGRRPLARGDEGGVPPPPAHVAHLLARQVPRLPAQRAGRDQEARPRRARALPGLLPVGRDHAQGPRGQPRAVGLQPLRQAALPALLHVLHREGVGRARPPRCAPSGPPSGSRASRSSPPPRPRSSATRATRSSR